MLTSSSNGECLNGWSFAHRDRLDWIQNLLSTSKGDLQFTRVNKRGDTLLHAAVTLKLRDLLTHLLDEPDVTFDTQNTEGETPLLCAMRAGSMDEAILLLDRGADPCIISHRQESPMHWLLSCPERRSKMVLEKIIEKGGWQTITTWAQTCNYAADALGTFRHYSERMCDGTPLHWALCRKKATLAKVLIDRGAPIDFTGPQDQLSPLEVAAHLHEAELLRFLFYEQARLMTRLALQRSKNPSLTDVERHNAAVSATNPVLYRGARMVLYAIEGSDRYSLIVQHGEAYKTFSRRTFALLGRNCNSEKVKYGRGFDGEGRSALHVAVRGGYELATELILQYLDGAANINSPYGNEYWTPICEAVRRDHESLFDLLVSRGADVNVRVDSPTQKTGRSWSLLHIAARSAFGARIGIGTRLVDRGVPLDSYGAPDDPAESPLSLAIENDAFALADLFRSRGANIQAASRYMFGGRIILSRQISILGRVIAANMRYSKYRLKYLLYPPASSKAFRQASFNILSDLKATALHWNLMFHEFLPSDSLIDMDTRIEVFRILLDRFDAPEELNSQDVEGNTALHLAAKYGSIEHIRLLVDDPGGSNLRLKNNAGSTASDTAIAVKANKESKGQKDGLVAL